MNMSSGEKKISQILTKHKIDYIFEKKFDDCKSITHLRFDFYLPDHNICIEFDGEQHFRPVDFEFNQFYRVPYEKSLARFKKIQTHDQIKNHYCNRHNIELIRISYKKFKNIEHIINKRILKKEI